jgi:chromosome segregation ATPase
MAIAKSSPGAQKIEERVTQIYQVAKQNPEDAHLQEAVSLIKSLRRSQGALQGWNGRYKEEKGELTREIEQMNAELSLLNQQMGTLTEERAKLISELKHIETEVQVAAIRVKNTKNTFGKLTILWTLVKSLFLDDLHELGPISDRLDPEDDRPQMQTDTASNNRSLLENK